MARHSYRRSSRRAHPQSWAYLFNYRSPARDGRLGAWHSLDIPFIWGTTTVENVAGFCGSGPDGDVLSERMMAIHSAFAKNGDPNAPDLTDWPVYDAGSSSTMQLDRECRVEQAPAAAERGFWAALRDDRLERARSRRHIASLRANSYGFR